MEYFQFHHHRGSLLTAEMSPVKDRPHAQGPTKSSVEEPLTEITAPNPHKQGKHFNTMQKNTLLTVLKTQLPPVPTSLDVSAASAGR